jgi:acyl carrier protein
MGNEARVLRVVKTLLERRRLPTDVLAPDAPLHRGGLGLDSLGAAELSVMLEMEFQTDPYTEGEVPRSVADIVRFYDDRATGRP